MVRAVFLDVDNTLLDFDLCGASAMRQGFEELGLPFSEQMYFDTFTGINEPLWQKIERGELTKDELFANRWNMVFRALGITADGPAFEKRFHDFLLTAAIPVVGALELVRYLKEKYTVCVASNAFYDQQVRRLTAAGIYPFIDHMFISERIGFHKPSREFFDCCFASLPDISPGEAVMVGDSLTADIAGGAGAGMQTIWFNRRHIAVPPHCDATYVVRSLSEIAAIL